MEKSLRMENQKRKKVTGKKRKKRREKKKLAQRRKKEYHSVKKGKNFVEATGTGGAPRCPDFEQEIAGKPKFAS